MSQGIVQTIIQDKKGFLWFGTWNGLNKFDGYTFKNYKTSYKDAYIPLIPQHFDLTLFISS